MGVDGAVRGQAAGKERAEATAADAVRGSVRQCTGVLGGCNVPAPCLRSCPERASRIGHPSSERWCGFRCFVGVYRLLCRGLFPIVTSSSDGIERRHQQLLRTIDTPEYEDRGAHH